jgi:16S rRNA (cytidine1402-2'-O)-methyltransferase
MARPLLAPPALSEAPLEPGLYLVATPIGNLRDVTLRALDVLSAADLVLAEDTRVTAKLLSAYGLSKKLERHDEHAAERATPRLVEALKAGATVALVSDAGTPLVSDPGFHLAREAIAAGVRVYPIPGASAPLAALTVAGLPSDRFMFVGFPPPKSAARRTFFQDLAAVRATLIFFEGGSRLAASLADMATVFGDRPACVCRPRRRPRLRRAEGRARHSRRTGSADGLVPRGCGPSACRCAEAPRAGRGGVRGGQGARPAEA